MFRRKGFVVCRNLCLELIQSFPGGSVVKNTLANAGGPGDVGLIIGSGRSPGVENGNTFQYSCLENFTDRGVQGVTVHGIAKSQT